ncbi:hypothetical protein BN59_02590 [Legionella massiliensis]|uniref:Uncharacterized protein n=1 Tax=Legionella massiliensis TaxID=1034943 RepID=A0A078KV13_9GAMM|nr:hypothetical protein [Legionella massiliensis]CDZ78280.1 hypothetical protein BN59_02590 [Legionella massiliensis]CEE14018.1 hypothetical protein BN1094_02590 [Legionella massiliensis]
MKTKQETAIEEESKKKSLEMKDALQKEIIEAERRAIQEDRAVQREKAEHERIEATKDPLSKKPYWELVKEDGRKLASGDVAGYNDWATGMCTLVRHLMLLADAMWYDPIFPFRDQIVGFKNTAVDLIWDNTAGRFSDWVQKKQVGDDELAKIEVHAEIKKDGTIDVEISKDNRVADGSPQAEELRRHIQVGITAWAMINGYDLDTNTGAYVSEADGTPMTPEVFDRLNKSASEGLESFISNRFEMPITTTYSM